MNVADMVGEGTRRYIPRVVAGSPVVFRGINLVFTVSKYYYLFSGQLSRASILIL
jgi:hypothetical protein